MIQNDALSRFGAACQDSPMGKALKEMQQSFTFLALPAHGLFPIVKERPRFRFFFFFEKHTPLDAKQGIKAEGQYVFRS